MQFSLPKTDFGEK